jgi:hypothetical protein
MKQIADGALLSGLQTGIGAIRFRSWAYWPCRGKLWSPASSAFLTVVRMRSLSSTKT